jgi:hypothetical protein
VGPFCAPIYLWGWVPIARRLPGKVHKVGGNYAFLFPEANFAELREITLHGPGGLKIPFSFSLRGHVSQEGLIVAYVGRASNLNQRLQWHFSGAKKNTAAQVQHGLVNSGICDSLESAIHFMLNHAVIAYRELPGVENTANRDLLELSLCAQFAPPFNIKSER